ncbi:hypothetical protein BC940DRAFT_368537 [Gongronella butleri]|nr:hypothetical protein BC940DRAFT_368537 [Gongronella butleri]
MGIGPAKDHGIVKKGLFFSCFLATFFIFSRHVLFSRHSPRSSPPPLLSLFAQNLPWPPSAFFCDKALLHVFVRKKITHSRLNLDHFCHHYATSSPS